MDEMLPSQTMCGWGVWRKGHMQPVSLHAYPCRWGGEDPPYPGRKTDGFPDSDSLVVALLRRTSGCTPLSPISNLLVADGNLYLLCLMTEPHVTPSPTSP